MSRMTTTNTSPSNKLLKRLFLSGITVLIFSILLGLDLANHGLAWQFFWSQTGEEKPLAQIRGMVEVAGNLIREPLDTQPYVAIDNKAEIPYGVNTFLQDEVERPKIEVMLQTIQDAGFVWLRQEFPWEDIEVDGRGQFTDSRQDRDGDGEPDTIDAWLKYDQIVDLTEQYGLKLMVRLSNPPDWSRANPDEGSFAPPDDYQDYVNFAVAVAERYKGRITHYQIWNEPNIYPEWGNNFVDPAGYTDLLCRTYTALKAVDPDIVVISGAIAPTISLDGYFGFSDLIFLQIMYDNGAADCFDVLAAQGYGLYSGPTDNRLRATSVNVVRHTYYRDIMVKNGDAEKSIWLSEAAWNATLDADLPPQEIDAFNRFGNVTQEQAARYMPILYDRAQQEWSWVGNVTYWFFTRKDPFEANQSFYYFRMVEPDYQPETPRFTPLPVYDAVKDYITTQEPVLYRGTHQAETWQIATTNPDLEIIDDESAQFAQAIQANGLTFRAHGTDLYIRWKSDIAADWQTSYMELSAFTAETKLIDFPVDNGSIIVDSILVSDRTWNRLIPLAGLGLAAFILLLGTIGSAIGKRLRK